MKPTIRTPEFCRRGAAAVAAAAVLAATSAVSAATAAGNLIRNGEPAGYVVLPGGTGEGVLRSAAEDLVAILTKMGGKPFPLRFDWDFEDNEPPGFRILVGATSLAPVRAAWISPRRVGYDGFVIRSVRNGVVIAGRTAAGTANGVCQFAEQVLDAHWWSMRESGPTVPRRANVTVPRLRLTVKPDFAMRINWLSLAAKYLPEDVAGRDGAWSRFQGYGGLAGYAGHILYDVVPADLFETHPEYFPWIDGQRRRQHPKYPSHGLHNIQRCFTNPDVLRMAVEHTRAFFEQYPDLRWASLSPNDGGGYCDCAACRELGPTPAYRHLAFANRVAEANEALFPNRRYAFYAYMGGSLDPPRGMRAHRNVFPIITPVTLCRTHSILSECPSCTRRREAILGWDKIADRLGMYTYLNGGPYCTPALETVAAEIRFLRDHGGFTFRRENTAAPSAGWEMLVWVQAKLLWDADRDVAALRRQFIEGYYGRACADRVEAVFAAMDRGVRNLPVTPLPPDWDKDQNVHPHNALPRQKLQPLIDACHADLVAAVELAATEPDEGCRQNVIRDMGILLGKFPKELEGKLEPW